MNKDAINTSFKEEAYNDNHGIRGVSQDGSIGLRTALDAHELNSYMDIQKGLVLKRVYGIPNKGSPFTNLENMSESEFNSHVLSLLPTKRLRNLCPVRMLRYLIAHNYQVENPLLSDESIAELGNFGYPGLPNRPKTSNPDPARSIRQEDIGTLTRTAQDKFYNTRGDIAQQAEMVSDVLYHKDKGQLVVPPGITRWLPHLHTLHGIGTIAWDTYKEVRDYLKSREKNPKPGSETTVSKPGGGPKNEGPDTTGPEITVEPPTPTSDGGGGGGDDDESPPGPAFGKGDYRPLRQTTQPFVLKFKGKVPLALSVTPRPPSDGKVYSTLHVETVEFHPYGAPNSLVRAVFRTHVWPNLEQALCFSLKRAELKEITEDRFLAYQQDVAEALQLAVSSSSLIQLGSPDIPREAGDVIEPLRTMNLRLPPHWELLKLLKKELDGHYLPNSFVEWIVMLYQGFSLTDDGQSRAHVFSFRGTWVEGLYHDPVFYPTEEYIKDLIARLHNWDNQRFKYILAERYPTWSLKGKFIVSSPKLLESYEMTNAISNFGGVGRVDTHVVDAIYYPNSTGNENFPYGLKGKSKDKFYGEFYAMAYNFTVDRSIWEEEILRFMNIYLDGPGNCCQFPGWLTPVCSMHKDTPWNWSQSKFIWADNRNILIPSISFVETSVQRYQLWNVTVDPEFTEARRWHTVPPGYCLVNNNIPSQMYDYVMDCWAEFLDPAKEAKSNTQKTPDPLTHGNGRLRGGGRRNLQQEVDEEV